MSVYLQLGRDVQGYPTKAMDFSLNQYTGILAQNTPVTVTIPKATAKWLMSIVVEPGANVWIAHNDTAAIPATSGVISTSVSELICSYQPFQRVVYANDDISLVTSDTTAKLSIALYSIY